MLSSDSKITVLVKSAQKDCNEEAEMALNETIRDLKHKLLRAWPLRWPRARTPQDIRFIFLGKELADDDKISGTQRESEKSGKTFCFF
jgi:hypothetical protein